MITLVEVGSTFFLAFIVTSALLIALIHLLLPAKKSQKGFPTMTVIGWIQILLYCAIVLALVKPLGWYMTRVFSGERTFLSPVLRPVEAGLYRLGGVDETREQDWLTYGVAMLLFHVFGFLILYLMLRVQGLLPLNPQGMSAMPEALSFNTAVSFVTNTNWQN